MTAGEHVTLRAREPEDAPYLSAWQSDPETMRWWDRVYPPLPAELLAPRLAAAPAPSFTDVSFTIVDTATGTPVGWCGLHGASAPDHGPSAEHRNASIAVMIGDASFRGRGYGTDATRTLCRFGFERMNLVRLSLEVFPGNVAARRTYERLGFVEEGVQRACFWKRGEWHDLVHMAVFPETLR